MTYRDRFEELLSNPRLVSTEVDVEFATSLFDSYKSNGSLSRGRKDWLVKLEDKYKAEGWIDPLGDEIGTVIKTILANDKIQGRDRDFISSIKNQYIRYKNLSEKQRAALISVFDRHSPEGQKKVNEWKDNYNKNHKREAEIAARYYLSNPPYFGQISQSIIEEEGFVPSERQFNKLTKNKYAARVIESTLSEPKFKVDDVVELRANVPYNTHLSMSRKTKGFILKVNSAPVTSAAKSSKNYLVLPIGGSQPVQLEERWIKMSKKI